MLCTHIARFTITIQKPNTLNINNAKHKVEYNRSHTQKYAMYVW